MSASGEKVAECDWGPEQASQGKGCLVLHALDGVKGYLEEIGGTSICGTRLEKGIRCKENSCLLFKGSWSEV